jgi:hypothetical protein
VCVCVCVRAGGGNCVPGLNLTRHACKQLLRFFAQAKEYGGGIHSTEEHYVVFGIDANSWRTTVMLVRTSNVAQIDIIEFSIL